MNDSYESIKFSLCCIGKPLVNLLQKTYTSKSNTHIPVPKFMSTNSSRILTSQAQNKDVPALKFMSTNSSKRLTSQDQNKDVPVPKFTSTNSSRRLTSKLKTKVYLYRSSCPQTLQEDLQVQLKTKAYLHRSSCPQTLQEDLQVQLKTKAYLHRSSCPQTLQEDLQVQLKTKAYLHRSSCLQTHNSSRRLTSPAQNKGVPATKFMSTNSSKTYLHRSSCLQTCQEDLQVQLKTKMYLHQSSCLQTRQEYLQVQFKTKTYPYQSSCLQTPQRRTCTEVYVYKLLKDVPAPKFMSTNSSRRLTSPAQNKDVPAPKFMSTKTYLHRNSCLQTHQRRTCTKVHVHKLVEHDGYLAETERMPHMFAVEVTIAGILGMDRHGRVTEHGLDTRCGNHNLLICKVSNFQKTRSLDNLLNSLNQGDLLSYNPSDAEVTLTNAQKCQNLRKKI